MEKALEAGAPLLPRYSEAAADVDPRIQVALLQQQVSALQAAQDRRRRIGKAILFGVLGYFLLAPLVGRMVLPFLPNSVTEYDYGFTSEEYGYDLSNDMVVPDFYDGLEQGDEDARPEPLHPPFKHRPGKPGPPEGRPEGKCIPAPMTPASEEELEQVFSAFPIFDAERDTAETDDDEDEDSDDDDEEAECEDDSDEDASDETEFSATPIDDSREGPRRPPGPPGRGGPGPRRPGMPGRGRGRCPGRGRRPPPRGPGGPGGPGRHPPPPFHRRPPPPPHRGFPGRRPHPGPPHRGPGGRPPMPPHHPRFPPPPEHGGPHHPRFPPPPEHGGPGRRPIRRFPRFQEVPYEVIANGSTYEIRKYTNLTVAWATGNGTAAKPSFETMKVVFKYLLGSNNDTESGDCFMIPPVKPAFSLADGEHAGQAILALPLPARLARVPTPLNSQVQIRVLPEFHAAVKKIEGEVTDEAIDKIFAELKDEVKDGYKVISDAKPEVARYTPPWVPARWQRNEVLAPVQKA